MNDRNAHSAQAETQKCSVIMRDGKPWWVVPNDLNGFGPTDRERISLGVKLLDPGLEVVHNVPMDPLRPSTIDIEGVF